MKALLSMEPNKRFTSREALKHQYFSGLNEEFLNRDDNLIDNKNNCNNLERKS